ncbi:hypothetical protein BDR05DRAFT_974171 [Suillus weaverae]|nr:hypothetical protein BDR05DRAFT_974171 [Suillus weaverae]
MSVSLLYTVNQDGTAVLTHWLMGQRNGTLGNIYSNSVMAGASNTSHFYVDQPFLATLLDVAHPPHDHLCLWQPFRPHSRLDHDGIPVPLSNADFNRILTVIGHSLASGTCETYGSGLLVFHIFCDAWGVLEEQRGFIAGCAGLYSGKMLENYFHGVRAWHLLHGLKWFTDSGQVTSALQGATRLAPSASKCPKHNPFTASLLIAIHSVLDLSAPLNAAVYACLVTSFFSLARLGEVTLRSLKAFNPSIHVKVSDIRYDEDRHGFHITVFHLPQTKTSSAGEDLHFAAQSGDINPQCALENNLTVNMPPPSAALFSWRHQGGLCPLTWSEFLHCLNTVSACLGIEPLKGHGIRVGGTLEYLLHGMPFEMVKSMGCWSGDSFVLYLQQHAVVLAPYLQDTPVLVPFTHYAMPPVH